MSDDNYVDLRHGIRGVPIRETPIMGSWKCPVKDDEILAVIEELETKAQLVQEGLDEFSKAEKFAYLVLYRNAECGSYG